MKNIRNITRVYQLVLAFVFGILASTQCRAQEPLTYKIPGDLLENISVYSLAQDQDGRIWIASDLAIYMYNGYDVVQYTYKEKSVSSYYSLAQNSQGDLFCCSLTGDIFKVNTSGIKLVYSLPDSCLTNSIEIKFDLKDNLIIQAKSVYKLTNFKTLLDVNPSYNILRIFTFLDGEDILFKGKDEKGQYYIFRYDSQSLKKEAFLDMISPINGTRHFYGDQYKRGNENILVSWKDSEKTLAAPLKTGLAKYSNGKIIPFTLPNQNEIEGLRVRCYGTKSYHILAHPESGAWIYDSVENFAFASYKLFPSLEVSSVIEDKEGNLWIGTLGGGLHLVSDYNTLHYNNHPLLLNETIETITTDQANNLFFGCKSGTVYNLKGDEMTLHYTHHRAIRNLYHFVTYPYLILDCEILDENKKLHPMSTGIDYTIYDIAKYKNNQYLFGTYGGLFSYKLGPNGEIPESYQVNHRENVFKNNILTTSMVDFDSSTNLLWTKDLEGKKIYDLTEEREIHYNDVAFQKMKGSTRNKYGNFGTDGQTIYWLDRYEIIDSLGSEEGVLKNHDLIASIDSTIVIFKTPFVQLLNIKTKELTTYSGLTNIKEFSNLHLLKGQFWMLSSSKSLVSFDPKELRLNLRKPAIRFDHISADNIDISSIENPTLDWQKHDLFFSFFTDAYKHASSLIFYYKIDGLDDDWKKITKGENSIGFPYLPSGKFTFMLKSVNENGIESEPISYPFKIRTPWFRSWWFIGIIMLAIAGIIWGRFKLVNSRLRSERDRRVAEIRAINSQMNPHFVFNALNSVQDLIMQKDIRNSNIYLGKFADLMRQTLDYSQKEQITVRQELDTATLYLDLEKLRFGDDFTFAINSSLTEDELDELKIPSLLLQPYIENAIKHGLLHQKGEKNLIIDLYKDSHHLAINITDNGVGRIKSAEINARRRAEHKSFAMDANAQRLALIKESTGKEIILNISDLEPSGTKVSFIFQV